MLLFAFLAFLPVTSLADYQAETEHYSFSPQVGSGSGRTYTITGSGRITAVRVWEAYSNYIYGFQFRYGHIWSNVSGYSYGQPQEMTLFDGEAIVQISGKYAHYVQSIVFTTNKGRSLYAGQPQGHSFNMYPTNKDGELRFISGRFHGAITSIAAHWGVVSDPHNVINKQYIQ
ncbi:zymogen granule membrane protein 16-like [Dunckerocampus dactyliophorus]|uniref:zymogen granule membrane protein 16-like n=1 Tax=Dunckerocampus dactyliophorus TaxID=161453 RepID=UPI0024051983|nr:zymogen granule membrane protein 16-like [Dunckerocampus dactyliophorus]